MHDKTTMSAEEAEGMAATGGKVGPRRTVEMIDEGDVGCSGKSKSKSKRRGGPPSTTTAAEAPARRGKGDGAGTASEPAVQSTSTGTSSDASAASATGAPAAKRRTVEMIDEGDVGCSGKSKSKSKRRGGPQPTAAAAEAPARGERGRYGELHLRYPQVKAPASECGLCAPPGCCYQRQIGRMYVCCEHTVKGQPQILCAIPACWSMHLVTQALILGVAGVVFVFALPAHHWWVWVAAAIVVPCTSLALCRTGTSDPGLMPLYDHDDSPPTTGSAGLEWFQKEDRVGSGVWVGKPASERPVWCHESQVFVHGYDHFCPWTGTTIAAGNMCWFQMFLALLCTSCIFVGVVGVTAMAMSSGTERDDIVISSSG